MEIAIPVETKMRELDGKLWLAIHLVERGHSVVLGHHPPMREWLDELRPDIYISVAPGGPRARLRRFRRLNAQNVSVMILDNEGGIFKDDQDYLVNISPKLLTEIEHFFAWGRRPAETVSSATDLRDDQISITGPPWFDLLQERYRRYYAPDAEDLVEEYGDFVLVTTNFGLVNHYDDDIKVEMMTDDEMLRLEKPDDRLETIPIAEEIFKRMLSAIPEAAYSLPETTFIVRPHPSENHSTYRKSFEGLSNVVVNAQGPVHPWILGANALIHNNSTTGVEGVLLDRPVLAFEPITDEDYDAILPNRLSRSVDSESELVEVLKKIVESGPDIPDLTDEERELLRSYIANLDFCAADRISEVIDASSPAEWSGSFGLSPVERSKRTLKYGYPSLYGLVRKSVNIAKGRSSSAGYVDQKFPGIEADELRTKVDRMKRLRGKFESLDLRIEPAGNLKDCYRLRPA